MSIAALVDPREGVIAETGEACLRVVDSGRPPAERSHLRLGPSRTLWVDAAYVPVPSGAEPVAVFDAEPGASRYRTAPRPASSGRS